MVSKKCTLFSKYDRNENLDLFFSTTWCRDRLFTSENPNDILKFYDTFSNRDELIQWMKERPKGRAEIIEVEGDKEIIVVIPTADFNGRYAKECRENIFKGLHIIFVESGYPKDPYFNYAHNCNVGIKKAMEYNPKWIVLSNDDMIKVDDPSVLINELKSINPSIINAVFTDRSEYHSVPSRVTRARLIRKILFFLSGKRNDRRERLKLEKKFKVRFLVANDKTLYGDIFFKPGQSFVQFTDFAILSSRFVAEHSFKILDDAFINGGEDVELSLSVFEDTSKITYICYRIGDNIGATMGNSKRGHRALRDVVNEAYFSFLIERKHIDIDV
ncbi:MAG: hypothetical protein QW292_09370 [Candidatus Parvarchaeota archaeon]